MPGCRSRRLDAQIPGIDPPQHRYFRGSCFDGNDAEDMVQDWWMRIRRSRRTRRSSEAVMPWICASPGTPASMPTGSGAGLPRESVVLKCTRSSLSGDVRSPLRRLRATGLRPSRRSARGSVPTEGFRNEPGRNRASDSIDGWSGKTERTPCFASPGLEKGFQKCKMALVM